VLVRLGVCGGSEQPFGDDADDLPLEEYCLGIEKICLDFLKRSPFK
jgi:predicted membrane chloride channel (bestrophin family)